MEDKYKVIFVIGAPGAGKNTQCDLLVEKYHFIHFGAGDLLREESKKDSEDGELIRNIIKEGKIVPVKITCGLIKKNMDLNGKDKIFLIDGYPRNQDNINGFLEVFGDSYQIICTLYLSCDETTCINRIKFRSQTSGRIDDSEEIIKKRFNTFYSESFPIVDELKKLCSIIEVPSISDKNLVFEEICKKIDPLINFQN